MNTTWLNSLSRHVKDNSPAILSAAAVGGVIATAVLASRSTIKAKKRLDEISPSQITPKKDVVQAVWTLYIPPALTGAATIACIVGANQIGLRRNAALLGAYTMADTAFREYKDAVVEELGKDKDQKIRDRAATKKMQQDPPENNQVIITGGGEQLCRDDLTGRYFRSDIEKIRRAANDVDAEVLSDVFGVPHNRFYELIGLPGVRIGEELGWNVDHRISLVFTSYLAEDGTPCLNIQHRDLPVLDFGRTS